MEIVEEIVAWGHPNIRALHRSTMEITKEPYVTPRGDCIIAVKANKALYDFSESFKRLARNPKSRIVVVIRADGLEEIVEGYGHPKLEFKDKTSIVIRKSDYICPRTLMIRANKAAIDLSRELVKKLRREDTKVRIRIKVYVS